mgnify:CR=1 FL=1
MTRKVRMPLLRRMLMDMKKWMRCAAAVVLSVFGGVQRDACSQPANIESGAVSQEYPVTVNEVTLNAKPQKVAVLSGSLADVVLAMGTDPGLFMKAQDLDVITIDCMATDPVASGIVDSATDSGDAQMWAQIDLRPTSVS